MELNTKGFTEMTTEDMSETDGGFCFIGGLIGCAVSTVKSILCYKPPVCRPAPPCKPSKPGCRPC